MALISEVAAGMGAAEALLETLDEPGLGFVTRAEAEPIIASLAAAADGTPPSEGDVASMTAMLKAGADGLVHREAALAALHAALAPPVSK